MKRKKKLLPWQPEDWEEKRREAQRLKRMIVTAEQKQPTKSIEPKRGQLVFDGVFDFWKSSRDIGKEDTIVFIDFESTINGFKKKEGPQICPWCKQEIKSKRELFKANPFSSKRKFNFDDHQSRRDKT